MYSALARGGLGLVKAARPFKTGVLRSLVRVDTLKVALSDPQLPSSDAFARIVQIANSRDGAGAKYTLEDFNAIEHSLSCLDCDSNSADGLSVDCIFGTICMLDSYRRARPATVPAQLAKLYAQLIRGLGREIDRELGQPAPRADGFALVARAIQSVTPACRSDLARILNKLFRRHAVQLLREGRFDRYINLISACMDVKTVQALFHLEARHNFRFRDFGEGGVLGKCSRVLRETKAAEPADADLLPRSKALVSSPIYPEEIANAKQVLSAAKKLLSAKRDAESVAHLLRVETLLQLLGFDAPTHDDVASIAERYFLVTSLHNFRYCDLASLLKLLTVTKSGLDIRKYVENLPKKDPTAEDTHLLAQFKCTRFGPLLEEIVTSKLKPRSPPSKEVGNGGAGGIVGYVNGIKVEDLGEDGVRSKVNRLIGRLGDLLFERRWAANHISGAQAGDLKGDADDEAHAALRLAELVVNFESVRPMPESDGIPMTLVRKIAQKYQPQATAARAPARASG
ncbi:hypothetical protein BMR1_01G03460 [Babesia microti strain RI]|uniref:Uncharacterized protein n=1 Tax=Babesia microti (strain RI) TaxID=1133968 RepID=I7IPR0_BABMR|nr:hypothetical protein BMR1_01G03460 [Babesia microti strain RI]CCF73150.1 hypothetical protein BMR1_01G03460 [Babesia microti strain RI]|eukprot:XP_012647759.1 hypothetical protein BMR1_01G03460 [Babesia microti strain RI]